jgi:hypothetical protein
MNPVILDADAWTAVIREQNAIPTLKVALAREAM